MSRISDRSATRRRAFTLVELMVGLSLSFIVIAGILSAYLFMGRNLTRLVNLQNQEVQSRRALQQFTTDVSSATAIGPTASNTVLMLSVQSAGANPDGVTYTYTAGANNTGTLTRAVTPFGGALTTTTLLTGLSTFDFEYYTESNISTTSVPSIKSVQFSFTTVVGTAASGTQASYTTVSARVVMRNKQSLL